MSTKRIRFIRSVVICVVVWNVVVVVVVVVVVLVVVGRFVVGIFSSDCFYFGSKSIYLTDQYNIEHVLLPKSR